MFEWSNGVQWCPMESNSVQGSKAPMLNFTQRSKPTPRDIIVQFVLRISFPKMSLFPLSLLDNPAICVKNGFERTVICAIVFSMVHKITRPFSFNAHLSPHLIFVTTITDCDKTAVNFLKMYNFTLSVYTQSVILLPVWDLTIIVSFYTQCASCFHFILEVYRLGDDLLETRQGSLCSLNSWQCALRPGVVGVADMVLGGAAQGWVGLPNVCSYYEAWAKPEQHTS